MNQRKEQLAINTAKRTSVWQGFAKRKPAVKGQLSKVNCSTRGFTVIELLVTFSIYVIISTVVIANYREYSTNAVSANAPEDIVLALRQAQV